MPDLFSPAGIAEWRNRLEHSTAFRDAAGKWTGTVLLVESNRPEVDRATFVAVDQGAIVAANPATAEQEAQAEFVLSASAPTWRNLTTGNLELISAALSGQLRLERGSVLRLIPHARAASVLLREAGGDQA